MDAASLAAARRHAAGCRRCATFVRGLERLDAAAGSERAGDDLVERIIVAARAETAATGDAAEPVPERAHGPAHAIRRWHVPRLTWGLAASAAVVALFVGARLLASSGAVGGFGGSASTASVTARSLGGGALSGSAAAKRTEMWSTPASPGAKGSSTGSGSASVQYKAQDRAGAVAGAYPSTARPRAVSFPPEPLGSAAPTAEPPPLGETRRPGFIPAGASVTGKPAFLSFHGEAWRMVGWERNIPSTLLVAVGTVTARLGSTGPAVERGVYEWPGRSDVRLVTWADDDYQVYSRVIRVVGGRQFSMRTTVEITDWGTWPKWPDAIAPYPRSLLGLTATTVSRGVTIYAVGGVPPAKGVAVPPTRPGHDRVCPIPKWTWYEPLDTATR